MIAPALKEKKATALAATRLRIIERSERRKTPTICSWCRITRPKGTVRQLWTDHSIKAACTSIIWSDNDGSNRTGERVPCGGRAILCRPSGRL